jgi:serpin B
VAATPKAKPVPTVDPAVPVAAESANSFACDLYRQLSARPGNRLVSPVGVATVLSMALAGAAGETKAQMRDVMHLSVPDDQVHKGTSGLAEVLNTPVQGLQLHLASRTWLQSGFSFEEPFLAVMRRSYGGEPALVDFSDAEAARGTINQWTSEQTEGKIAELLPSGLIADTTRFVLTNAIYFKGSWTYVFPVEQTYEAPFHLSAQERRNVSTMHLTGALRYGETPDVQMLELPYVGGAAAMVIVLPRQVDGLAVLEKSLTAESLNGWINGLQWEDEVQVHLPKFKFRDSTELKESLVALGMKLAFDDDLSDFSAMTHQKRQQLDAVLHETFVDVNEEGTEAAAVTGGIGGDAPGPVPQTRIFNADHPFLFLIRDNRTGAILFLGRIANPLD